MERRVNREYDIVLIIKCERACRGGSGLEWLSLSYLLYSFVLAVGMLLSLPFWLYQILRHGKYRSGLDERMGSVPARLATGAGARPGRVIWVHAVSLGEVLAVSGLVEEIRRAFPQHRVLVSTTTDTGQKLARKRFGEENVFYFPLDFAFSIRPYLLALQPELVVLAETEFWPNFLRLAHASGARIAVVNARISDRSWPRYSRFRWGLRKMLAAVDLFLTQTAEDSARLQSIGAEAGRVQVTGNLKFDVSLPSPAPIVERLRRSLAAEGVGPVLVCGSTVEDEEPPLLKAFENLRVGHPRAVMMLAPRHPERFDEVAILLQQLGIRSVRRTQWQGEALAGGVLLVDSIGELAALYALADIAFVGGSLVPRGGHNIIEPAQHGVAVVTGNHTENFRDIVALFQSRDAVRIVGLAELPLTLMQLLADDTERRALGRSALETIRSQTGATSRTLDALKTLVVADRDPLALPAQAALTD
jgi:3-deoxy-D-manno-octulosonic-acid transferase